MKLDVLQRDDFIEKLMNYIEVLSSRGKGGCFAIDGKWGIGKTFVLDSVEAKLKEIQCEETADNKYCVFHYNCWEYDYYNEPSIAIISAMLRTAEKALSVFSAQTDNRIKDTWAITKEYLTEIAGKFVENKIGINVVDIYNEIERKNNARERKNKEFDSLFAFKKTLDECRKILKEMAKEKTLIIVVDELDRCIPQYSIKVLERLHHIFEGIANIIVIIATDKEQLSHSIKEIYGSKTEVEGYLKKFIDFTLYLDEGKISNCYLEKYSTYISKFKDADKEEQAYIEDVLSNFFKGIDIRTQEKIMEKAELIHSLVSSKTEDIALMIYEIMVIRYKGIWNSTNLYWLPEINKATYSGLDEILGKEHVAYLKQLEKKVGGGVKVSSNNINYSVIGISINDRVFWILSQVYSEKLYFVEDVSIHKNEVAIAKEFSELARYIV